jgi:hypothetical protein
MKELTEEEMVHYANCTLIEECDCCHIEFSIRNYGDGKNYIEIDFSGKYFYCQKCK